MIPFVCLFYVLFIVQAEAVSIRLVGGSGPNEGRVEIYYSSSWGTVCDDSWSDLDAKVVCHELGYGNGEATISAFFGQGSGQIWLDNVKCLGSETALTDCSSAGWGIHNCGHHEDAGVICTELRLAGSLLANEGRVEVFYKGSWGTVCDSYWDSSEAAVVCRHLGYETGEAYYYAYFGTGSGIIWFRNFGCSGSERLLTNCSKIENNGGCTHIHDAGVSCVCTAGTYGHRCSLNCGKCVLTSCNTTSGHCSLCQAGYRGSKCIDECGPGTYGKNCLSQCGSCVGNCDTITGYCNPCKAGYRGNRCTDKCPIGRYGSGCNLGCGKCINGNDACNHINGYCQGGCDIGWSPPTCTEKCSGGTFGSGCGLHCGDCIDGDDACNHINGHCQGGCDKGWLPPTCDKSCSNQTYGYNCTETCPNCADECDYRYGNCSHLGCKPGWEGEKCDMTCSDGTFGNNCSRQCGHCNGTCNHIEGDCPNSCQPGWLGLNCSLACSDDTFGDNCSLPCGHCNGTCNHIDGICPNDCLPGWQGLNCSLECEDGFYGYNCSQVCGHCNGPCDHRSGVCPLKCLSGWKGSMCTEVEIFTDEVIVIISVSIIFFGAIFLAITCIFIKTRHRIIDLTRQFSKRVKTQSIHNENDYREMPETTSKNPVYENIEKLKSTDITNNHGSETFSKIVKLPLDKNKKSVKKIKLEKKKKSPEADDNLEMNENEPSDEDMNIYDEIIDPLPLRKTQKKQKSKKQKVKEYKEKPTPSPKPKSDQINNDKQGNEEKDDYENIDVMKSGLRRMKPRVDKTVVKSKSEMMKFQATKKPKLQKAKREYKEKPTPSPKPTLSGKSNINKQVNEEKDDYENIDVMKSGLIRMKPRVNKAVSESKSEMKEFQATKKPRLPKPKIGKASTKMVNKSRNNLYSTGSDVRPNASVAGGTLSVNDLTTSFESKAEPSEYEQKLEEPKLINVSAMKAMFENTAFNRKMKEITNPAAVLETPATRYPKTSHHFHLDVSKPKSKKTPHKKLEPVQNKYGKEDDSDGSLYEEV